MINNVKEINGVLCREEQLGTTQNMVVTKDLFEESTAEIAWEQNVQREEEGPALSLGESGHE